MIFSGCIFQSGEPTGEAFKPIISKKKAEPIPPCVELTNGMQFDYTFNGKTVNICPKTYNLPNGVHISAHDFTLDCQGAVLDGTGVYDESIHPSTFYSGIFLAGNNSNVKNCQTKNYLKGFTTEAYTSLVNNKAIGKTEMTTDIEIKDGEMFYEDANYTGVYHQVPFYTLSSGMSNGSTDTKIIDGQTIWYQIDMDGNGSGDGIITFRKDSSIGPLIREIYYVDQEYNQSVYFEGKQGKRHGYRVMVDEILSNVWLMKGAQPILTNYDKLLYFEGTDTDENTSITYPFYLPHSQYLPAELGGDTSYNSDDYYVAHFKIDEDGDTSGHEYEDQNYYIRYAVEAFIDTATGNLIVSPEIDLDSYFYPASYYSYGLGAGYTPPLTLNYLMEDPVYQDIFPSSAYTWYGSFVELKDHHFSINIPENQKSTVGFVVHAMDASLSGNVSKKNLIGLILNASMNIELSDNKFCDNRQSDIVCTHEITTTFSNDQCETIDLHTASPIFAGCSFDSCPQPCGIE